MKSHLPNQTAAFARKLRSILGWIMFGAAILFYLIQIPLTCTNIVADWQVSSTSVVVKNWLSFPDYVVLVFGVKTATSLMFIFTGFFILLYVVRQPGERGSTPFLTSLLLLTLPALFLMNPLQLKQSISADWGNTISSFLMTLQLLLGMIGLLLLLVFYFVFPGGAKSRFVRWVVVGLVILVCAFVLVQVGVVPEEAGLGFLLLLLLTAISGSVYQVIRLTRVKDRAERRQSQWVVAALLVLPASLLVSAFVGSPGGKFLSLWLQLILLALLPVSLFLSVVFAGLWDAKLPRRKGWVVSVLAGVLAVGMGGAFLADRLVNPPPPELVVTPIPVTQERLPVIIDTDMAPDDWMAILYLLQRPDVEVLAITVTGTGEAHCAPGVRNALRLVALADESGIPVACGRETPLQGRNVFPSSWRTTADEMLGLDLPESNNPAAGKDALTLLDETIRNQPGNVSILALGPLTNLAEALQNGSLPAAQIEKVVIMGGAVEVPGNIAASGMGSNVQAEWNFFIDPTAAQVVLESGLPVVLVPLDATNQVVLDIPFYRRLAANRVTPEARFVYDFLAQNVSRVMAVNYYFWDPLAAGILVDPSLAEYDTRSLTVITEARPDQGDLALDEAGTAVRYASSVNRERFYQEFLNGLNQP